VNFAAENLLRKVETSQKDIKLGINIIGYVMNALVILRINSGGK
jgi:hypothetical protein